jgi:hypothetical protein
MDPLNSGPWRHATNYSTESSCKHCAGVIRHEPWCVAVNEVVSYAYAIVSDTRELTFEDGLVLHALGVAWARNNAEARRRWQPALYG